MYSMKKICFIAGNLNNSGGTERVTSVVANELVKKNYDVSILNLTGGNTPFFILDKNIKNHSLYTEKTSFKKNFLPTIWKIRKFIKEHQIDMVIVVDSNSCLFTVPALFGLDIEHICWEHFNFNNDLGRYSRRVGRQLAARYCDAVVTLTERDKQYWLRGTSHKSQIIAIANPCPFPPQADSKINGSNTVLTVGELTKIKGFDLLLEAWVQVNSTMPNWKLIIVGEGEDRKKLTSFINEHNLVDSVDLVGRTSDVSKYYEKADIFCLSSRFEGFPMVLLETLAFGLPVVSFDCDTGPAEILEDTGSILVPKSNISQLALSLINLMKDESARASISLKAKEKCENYQPENIINQWIELLER